MTTASIVICLRSQKRGACRVNPHLTHNGHEARLILAIWTSIPISRMYERSTILPLYLVVVK